MCHAIAYNDDTQQKLWIWIETQLGAPHGLGTAVSKTQSKLPSSSRSQAYLVNEAFGQSTGRRYTYLGRKLSIQSVTALNVVTLHWMQSLVKALSYQGRQSSQGARAWSQQSSDGKPCHRQHWPDQEGQMHLLQRECCSAEASRWFCEPFTNRQMLHMALLRRCSISSCMCIGECVYVWTGLAASQAGCGQQIVQGKWLQECKTLCLCLPILFR